jgi:flagellar hook-length control protein FliK
MNSVASQMVATLMNSNFSALKSTSTKPSVGSQDFSKVFNQVNHRNDIQAKETKSNMLEGSEKNDLQSQDHLGKVTDTKVHDKVETDTSDKQVAEVVSEEVTNKANEITEEMGKEKVDLKAILEDPVNSEVVEEAMIAISELFGIPLESLKAIMQEMNVSALDLNDMGQLTDLVAEVFGHEDKISLLLDQEATQVLKEVKMAVETLSKELGIDLESLKEQLTAQKAVASESKTVDKATHDPVGKTAVEAPKPGEAVKLEVVDMRDAQSTTKYSQKNMNNQDQGSSTFSDLLGQNITLTKEVVVQNEVKQVLYQQISTKEVIDQIVTKAVVKLTPDKTSMQLQLNPGHLGKVSVSVTSEQGLVKSQFVAENQVVKEMLEANMIQLKEQLEEQGIKVDKIEVTVGDTNQYFNQKDQQEQQSKHASRKSSRSRVGSVASISEVDEIEAVTNQPQSVLDSGIDIHTVEYSA